MKPRQQSAFRRSSSLLIAVSFAMTVAGAHATSLTWDGSDMVTSGAQGGSGTWDADTTANWWDGISADVVWPAPGGTDDDAVFANTAGTVTLAVGGVTANDLTFNSTGYLIQSETITLNGTAPTITTDPGVSATISSVVAGSAGLVKSGAGTLILSGSNSYTGDTTVSGGILQLGDGITNGVISGNIVNTANVTFNNASAQTFAGIISGSGGSLSKAGSGTLLLSGANTYSGNTSVTAGTLVLQQQKIGGTITTASGAITEWQQTAAMDGNFPLQVAVTFTGAGRVNKTGAYDMYGDHSTGNSLKVNQSAGALFDMQAGRFDQGGGGGFISTNRGSLNVVSGATLGLYASNAMVDALTGSGAIVNGYNNSITLTVGAANHTASVDNPYFTGTSATFSGAISNGTSGTLALTKTGSGTQILTGTNSYSGGTTVNGGILQLGDGTTNGVITGSIVNTANVTFNNASAQTFAGNISGTGGSLIKTGSGTLTLSGSNSYTGGTSVNAGTLRLDLSSGGTKSNLGAFAIGASTNLELVSGTNTSADTTGLDQNTKFTGTGTLIKTGTGYIGLFFDGSATKEGVKNFAGLIDIQQGILGNNSAGWGAGPGAMDLNIAAGAVLDLRTGDVKIDALSGSGTIYKTWVTASTLTIGSNNGSATFSGNINPTAGAGPGTGGSTPTGAVALVKTGSGTQIFTGTNSYTGGTTVSGGILQLGDGTTNGVITGNIANTANVTFNNPSAQTFAGNISGTGGSLTKAGAGTLTLTGSSNYTGGTTVSGGSLQLGDGTTNGVITGDIANTANVTFNNPSAQTFAGVISGSGGTLGKSGAGTLTLTGNNSYTGATTINVGTLEVKPAAGYTTTSSGYAVAAGAAFTFSLTTANDATLASALSGAGTVNLVNTGYSMHLNANNSAFTGTLKTSGTSTLFLDTATATSASTAYVIDMTNGGGYYGSLCTMGVASGSTMNLGSLAGTTPTSKISSGYNGSGTITWSIGALGTDTTFAGYFANYAMTTALTKVGSGKLTLTGANAYTGATTITQGTLELVKATAFASNVALDATNAATLQLGSPLAGDSWTFNRTITGGSASAKIEKTGLGTVILTPVTGSSFTGGSSGALTVTGGKLYLNAAFTTAPAVSVGAGAVFGGTATAANVTLANTATLEGGMSGSGTLTAANLTIGSVAADTATLKGTLSTAVGYTPLAVTNLTLNGGDNTVTLEAAGAGLVTGTYYDLLVSTNVITAPNATSGLAVNVLKSNSRAYTPNVDATGKKVQLYYDATASVYWTGAASSAWNPTATNWKLSGNNAATEFMANDVVFFHDNPTSSTVDISNGNVNPISTTFDNTTVTAYTLQGSNGIASGSLIKSGNGSLTITNANSYSGGTTLSGGTLNLNNAAALGSGTLVINGGVLDNTSAAAITLTTNNAQTWSSNVVFTGTKDLNLGTGAVAMTASRDVSVTAGTLTVGGAISGTGPLTKSGAGTLVLSGINSYTGGTTVNAGTLRLDYSTRANFDNLGSFAIGASGTLDMRSGTNTNADSTYITYANITFTGTGTLAKTGTGYIGFGALTPGVSAFSGLIDVQQGILGNNTSNWGTGLMDLNIAAGAFFDMRTGNVNIDALSGAGTIEKTWSGNLILSLGNNNGSAIFSGAISQTTGGGSGTIALTKTGSGTQTLSGASNYSGGTTLSAGTLNINNASALGTGTLVINGGVLDNTSAAAITLTTNNAQTWGGNLVFTGTKDLNLGTGAVAMTASRDVSVTAGNLTVGGAISGTASLSKSGGGTLTLTGVNSYTGNTSVTAGTLVLRQQKNGGTITTASGAITEWQQTAAMEYAYVLQAGAVTFAGAGRVNKTGAFGMYGDHASGGPVRVNQSAGAVFDMQAGTFNQGGGGGGFIATNLGSLNVAAGATIGLVAGNATVDALTGSGTIVSGYPSSQTLTVGAANHTASVDNPYFTGTSATFSGVLANGSAGTLALAKTGSGTQILTGANTYGGGTSVTAGTLVLQQQHTGGTITTASGAITEWQQTATMGYWHGLTGTITFAGAGRLNKTGAFDMYGDQGEGGNAIRVSQSAGGVFDMQAGRFDQGSGGGFKSTNRGSLNVAAGATIGLFTSNATVDALTGSGTIVNGYGSATVTLTVGAADHTSSVDNPYFTGTSATYSGTIGNGTAGILALTKTGSGTQILTGTNTYSGGTTLSNGTLLVNNTIGSGTGSGAVIVNGGILGGTGSIAGAVTLNGGTLAPGASIESLAVGGDLTFATGTTFAYEMNHSETTAALTGDLLTVSGDGIGNSLSLAKATGEKVYLTLSDLAASSGAFAPNSTTLSLIQYVGTWNGGFFTYEGNELTDGEQFTDTYSNHWTISYAANTGGLNFASAIPGSHFITLSNLTAIPEPGSLLALGCLVGSGMLLRSRRRRP